MVLELRKRGRPVRCIKNNKRTKEYVKRQDGYFLAEIVTALAVLGIFLIAIVPLMSDSFSNLMRAGLYSNQMMAVQGNVARIAATTQHGTGLIPTTSTFPVRYISGSSSTVYGLQVTQSGITAGFFYNNESMPRIDLSPSFLEEGYEPYPYSPGATTFKITVLATNMTFQSGVTEVSMSEKGNTVTYNPNVINNRKLTFEIPLNLTNELSPYEVTVRTNNSAASATLQVGLPRMIAVGNASGGSAKVMISSGNGGAEGTEDFPGRTWTAKSCPASLNLNDAAINTSGDTWVAVGPSGNIKVWKDGGTWQNGTIVSGNTSPNLNAVTFFEKYTSTGIIQMFVAVGNGGVIYTSEDGLSWTQRTSPTTNNLYDVCSSWDTNPDDSTDNSRLVAVGAKGAVCTSTDGINWSYTSINTSSAEYTLYSVTFADETPATVGDERFWAGGHIRWVDLIFPFVHDRAVGVDLGLDGTTKGSVVISMVDSNIKEVLYYYTNTYGNPYIYAVDDIGRILMAQPGFFGTSWDLLTTINGKAINSAEVTEDGILIMVTNDGDIYTMSVTDTSTLTRCYDGSIQLNGVCLR